MLAKLRPRSAYDVMAALALFIALGGTAYAAATITGADVVDESLTGADVRGKAATTTTAAVNGALTGNDISGQPASAALGQPFVDGSLTTADIKNNNLTGTDVNEATLAKVPAATNADKLGGIAAKPVVQPVAAAAGDHDRCAETPPATGTFCSTGPYVGNNFSLYSNYGDIWAPANYYKDAFGIVHIEGLVKGGLFDTNLTDRIFILPPDYRPAASHIFIVTGREEVDADEAPGRIDVHANGEVIMTIRPDSNPNTGSNMAHLSLDGISFRAA